MREEGEESRAFLSQLVALGESGLEGRRGTLEQATRREHAWSRSTSAQTTIEI